MDKASSFGKLSHMLRLMSARGQIYAFSPRKSVQFATPSTGRLLADFDEKVGLLKFGCEN